jgi:NAD(P)-dependent dehydrogenase (short-subunit alcohol dehydrogenase family)
VAGGTGNVGRHIVAALLQRGATVVVPSRSERKLEVLRSSVSEARERLVTVVGDVADEEDGARIRDRITGGLPSGLDAVVASLGRWANAPSILAATRADLVQALEDYVVAHFVVARTFLPVLVKHGGSYTSINGPSAFGTWPGSGLVSIATAAQSMLARVLAEEMAPSGSVRVAELVIYPSAWIGPDDTGGGGPIDGPAVGRYVAAIVAGSVTGGPTLYLDSDEQIAALA